MPYISKNGDRREKLRNGEPALIAGELNYQIFHYVKHNQDICKCKIKKFVDQFLGENPNYQKYNDITGVLVRCFIEILRRLDIKAEVLGDILDEYNNEIARYEDLKRSENGDVE